MTIRIVGAEYLGGAPHYDALPKHELKEIALFGRSNVGKSTLINRLTSRRALARVSRTPGRTQAVHIFSVDARLPNNELLPWVLADLPGFGFAAVSKGSIRRLTGLLEGYIEHRTLLSGAVLLGDIRREPEEEELWIRSELTARGHRVILACTKSDKLSRQERLRRQRAIAAAHGVPQSDVVVVGQDMSLEPLLIQIESIVRGTTAETNENIETREA